MAEQLLSGVKVLDLGWHIAGPSCARTLGDFGADVLKIERPPGGDPARSMPPFLNDEPHPEKSLLFHHNNLNKRSITLNLKSDVGKDIFKRLVANADVVIENFSPGVMDRLGLGYDVLEAINPRLVMTSISNWGSTGPYRDFKASNIVLSGMAKAMYSSGVDGREPVQEAMEEANVYICGFMAAVASLAAYWHASERGVGQWLDLSMQEIEASDINFSTQDAHNWAMRGWQSPRRDPRKDASNIIPAGVFLCKDGFIELGGGGGMPRFLRFANTYVPEVAAYLNTLTYPSDMYNMEYRSMVDALWLPWCLEHTKQEIMDWAQSFGVFCTAIKTPKEAVDDPQLKERSYWTEVDHPVVGKQLHLGPTIDVYDAPWAITRPVPLLGQHNEEVYCNELGYSQEDVARWKAEGII